MIINVYCFKQLSFEVACYTVVLLSLRSDTYQNLVSVSVPGKTLKGGSEKKTYLWAWATFPTGSGWNFSHSYLMLMAEFCP